MAADSVSAAPGSLQPDIASVPELALLQRQLEAIFAGRPRLTSWGEPQVMRDSLERVNQAFARRMAQQTEARIGRALLALRTATAEAGGVLDFLDLKYACYGLARTLHEGLGQPESSILQNRAMLLQLLTGVERLQHERRRYAQCLRGLLAGYLESYESSRPLPEAAQQHREQLAAFLRQRLPAGSVPENPEARTFSLERKFGRESTESSLDQSA